MVNLKVFFGVFLVVIGGVFGLNSPYVSAYEIDGDIVRYENAYGKIEAYPHTSVPDINGRHEQWLNITSKFGTVQVLDFAVRFDYPVRGKVYEFVGGEWVDRTSLFNHQVHNDKHYYWVEDVTFNPSQTRQIHWEYFVPLDESGKYEVWIKRSSDTIQEALSSGNYVQLDPWFNASWNYRKNFTITSSQNITDYTVRLVLNSSIVDYDLINDDCSDLRFAINEDEIIPHYTFFCDQPGFVVTYFKYNVTAGSENVTMYYNYVDAIASDDERGAFLVGDSFDNKYGSEQWSIVDTVGGTFTIDRTTDERLEWTGLTANADQRVYMNLTTAILDQPIIKEYTHYETSAVNLYYYPVMSSDTWTTWDTMNNASGVVWDFKRLTGIGKLNTGIIASGSVNVNNNQEYYLTLTDDYVYRNLSIYTDKAKTNLIGTNSYLYSTAPTGYQYLSAITNFGSIYTQNATGYMDDIMIRKFVSPEPTISPQAQQSYAEWYGTPPEDENISTILDFDLDFTDFLANQPTNKSCLDNSTLLIESKTRRCLGTEGDTPTQNCYWFNNTQTRHCDNGCYDAVDEYGAGCSPPTLWVLVYTMLIFFIFVALTSILIKTGGRKRRRR